MMNARHTSSVAALVFALSAPVDLAAQNLALPSIESASSSRPNSVVLTWEEAPQVAGRDYGNFYYGSWDPDSSSTVTVDGDYAGDCDSRVRITRKPQDSGIGLVTEVFVEYFDQTAGTGFPVTAETLSTRYAETGYALNSEYGTGLSVRFSSNVHQPTTGLGGGLVTVRGLCTTSYPYADYQIVALNTVASLADTLQVLVTGPLPEEATIPEETLELSITAAGDAYAIMDGMEISLQEGPVSSGETAIWSANYLFPPTGKVDFDVEALAGYHIWRSDLPDLDSFTLLGEIIPCASRYTFADVDSSSMLSLDYDPAIRSFHLEDRNIHRDFPYKYRVTVFDLGFLGNEQNEVYEGISPATEVLYPGRDSRVQSMEAFVVPNPYMGSAPWEEGEAKVVFTNLPPTCDIQVFSVSAELVATFSHGPGNPRSTSPTTVAWNLETDRGEAIAPGVYLYRIEGILEDGADFGQTGKMVIAR
ncbi:MAG: hypothetical protein QF819_00355 [Gemmatimonadota bacterium]|jgi:hypothetical protein|nr:hypothetical protein [Gemmatimonadota bacterium]MDP6530219.1 hypothetical protein [Gemmatimonadota bacterium]MDP6801615.1 hypothetical protein [Gemmatimonadota bacterium]MDP7030838.1 hypothetical protein [Gemmatimonadota bacterium]